MGYVLDTNILNWLIDGKFTLDALPPDAELIVSHIQIDELNRTSDEERRAKLFLMLAQNVKNIVSTETAVADVSRLDNAKFSDGVLYNAIRNALDGRNGIRANNVHDALIGEIALVNQHVLVTADKDLSAVVMNLGGKVIHIAPL